MTDEVHEKLSDPERYRMRYLGQVPLKGKTTQIGVYEILDGLTDESAQRLEAHNTEFTRAITAYQEQRYPEAHRSFQAVLDADPDDEAARYFLDRSHSLINRGP